MPFVDIRLAGAASREQKAAIVADVTRSLVERLGKNPAAVQIVIEEVSTENYGAGGQLLADREQVRLRRQVQNETDAVKFSLIDPPSQSSVPASPNRPLLLFGVLIVGLGGGIASAFALGKLRSGFSTAARLERASGLPVIGSIGEVLTQTQHQLRQRRLKLFTGATAALGVAFVALIAVEFLMRGLAAA